MKRFYSVLDVGIFGLVTNRMQHLIIADAARRVGGKVVFYTAESLDTHTTQAVLKAKLGEKPNYDGIVFLRLKQFNYDANFDFALLLEILDLGYEAHFAREGLSFRTRQDLEDFLPTLHMLELLGQPRRHADLNSVLGADFESFERIVA